MFLVIMDTKCPQPDGSESGNPVEVPAATAFEQLNTSEASKNAKRQ